MEREALKRANEISKEIADLEKRLRMLNENEAGDIGVYIHGNYLVASHTTKTVILSLTLTEVTEQLNKLETELQNL